MCSSFMSWIKQLRIRGCFMVYPFLNAILIYMLSYSLLVDWIACVNIE